MTTQKPHPYNDRTLKTTKKKAFVVSPIGSPGTEDYQRAEYALKYIFKKALDPQEWEVHRADEGESPDSINQHVIRSLYEADLVIADLTGHNPNVFYELAIAHGIRKPVVHLISKGEKMPFDIIDQRAIFYDLSDLASVEDAITALARSAKYAIDNAEQLTTPLSNFARFSEIRESTSGSDAGEAVAYMLEKVADRLSQLEYQVSKYQSRGEWTPNSSQALSKAFDEYGFVMKRLESLEGKEGNLTEIEREALNQTSIRRKQLLEMYPRLERDYRIARNT